MDSLATLENYRREPGEGNYMSAEPWAFYNRYATTYGNWKYTNGVKQFQNAEKKYLAEHIQPHSRVIDIGCGPGEHLASITDKKCDVTAVDFVQEMIDIAKKRAGENVTFVCDDVKNLSFPKDYFDYGICYCTLPNQKEYRTIFDKISYYSRSLIISVYNWESRNEVLEFYRINGLHPEIDDENRTIFLNEGMRYILIPEEVVQTMYENNGYRVLISRHQFGNIYHGVK